MPPAALAGAGRTVAGARRRWAREFRAAGIDTPELDARVLVACALGLDHAAFAVAETRGVSPEEDDAIGALARRRLAHEPVARILGAKEFWSLRFQVDAATLVPRPETETVVEAALDWIDAHGPRARALRIADLGTGSGAILLALLSELPNAFGLGTDTSRAALAIARRNAMSLAPDRVRFVACEWAAALGGPFDLIVSNPPYIASDEIDRLAPEVRDFDPRAALDGGADGLHCYRALAAAVPALLAHDGALVVELGAGQARPVATLFAAAGLAPLPPRSDLMGIPRAMVASAGHDRRTLCPRQKST